MKLNIWINIIVLIFLPMCSEENKDLEKENKVRDEFTIKDYEQFCLIYHDQNSPYLYEFDKVEGRTIHCKIVEINGTRFYKPAGEM